jgi:Phospholipase_D-nuclease N-terminal
MNVDLPNSFQILLGLYAYLLPLLLYALFSTVALWDIGRRDGLPSAAAWLWPLAIFALPFVGAAAYLFVGGSKIAPRTKLLAAGGVVAYLLVLGLGAAIGGIT